MVELVPETTVQKYYFYLLGTIMKILLVKGTRESASKYMLEP